MNLSTTYLAPMDGGILLSSFLGHKGRSGHTELWAARPSCREATKRRPHPWGRFPGERFLREFA